MPPPSHFIRTYCPSLPLPVKPLSSSTMCLKRLSLSATRPGTSHRFGSMSHWWTTNTYSGNASLNGHFVFPGLTWTCLIPHPYHSRGYLEYQHNLPRQLLLEDLIPLGRLGDGQLMRDEFPHFVRICNQHVQRIIEHPPRRRSSHVDTVSLVLAPTTVFPTPRHPVLKH